MVVGNVGDWMSTYWFAPEYGAVTFSEPSIELGLPSVPSQVMAGAVPLLCTARFVGSS